MSDFRNVRQAIGQQVRALRTAHGRRQEQVADAARAVGLSWDRARIALLESGGKALSVEDLLRLPLVLALAGCGRPTLADLLPDDRAETVQLDRVTHATLGLLRDVLSGVSDPQGVVTVDGHIPRGFGLPRFATPEAEEAPAAHRDAERNAATKLGITAAEVVEWSRGLWGRSLTDEREARLAMRLTGGDGAGRRAALSGRITRSLVEELAAAVKNESGAR